MEPSTPEYVRVSRSGLQALWWIRGNGTHSRAPPTLGLGPPAHQDGRLVAARQACAAERLKRRLDLARAEVYFLHFHKGFQG